MSLDKAELCDSLLNWVSFLYESSIYAYRYFGVIWYTGAVNFKYSLS